MMPETFWDKSLIINIRLVASCWFLSLHPTFTPVGCQNPSAPMAQQTFKKLCPYEIRAAQLLSLDGKTRSCYCRCIPKNWQGLDFLMWTHLLPEWYLVYIQWECKLPPNNRYCCSKSLLVVHTTPLHGHVRLWRAVDAHKITGKMLSKEIINSYHHIQLIWTPLFSKLILCH